MIASFRRYLDTWVVRGFFLVMVLTFMLWGVNDMVHTFGASTWIAKAGGTTIEAQTMEPEFRRALQVASRDLPPGQEVSASLRRQVAEATLQRLIGQAAMTQEIQSLRLVVPDPALVDTIHRLPAFQGPDGRFDATKLDQTLRANGLSEPEFLNIMRGDLARKQLEDAITAGATVPKSEAGPIFAMQFEKRSADIARFPLTAFPEPPVPDEAAASRWYDNHPDLYVIPEYRRIKVIVLSPKTLANEVSVSDAEVQAAYEQHVADYTTVARRAAEVISAPDEARAKALADQWRAGADWTAMQAAAKAAGASSITQDSATQQEYPDPDLAKAVFSAPGSVVSDPVKGALGWFAVRVTSIVTGGVTPFEAVKDKLRERTALEKALDLVYERANKIDGLMANGGTLDQLPAALGFASAAVTVDAHGAEPDGSAAALPGETEIRDAILAAAFEAQKGDAPHLTEVQTPSTGGSGYYALIVEDIQPPGPKPFAAVRAEVNDDLRHDQRRHAAEVAAAAMLKAVKDGKSFSDAARDAGVTPNLLPLVSRAAGAAEVPEEVRQVLFGLKPHDPAMVENAQGFIVLTPVEIVAPDPVADADPYARLGQALAKTVANDMSSLFQEALRARANPRINQQNLDQLIRP